MIKTRRVRGGGSSSNATTRNPINVALNAKALREQILAIQAKATEVENAITTMSATTPIQVRTSLVKTLELYREQIQNLRARLPVGGKKGTQRFRRHHKKRI